MKRLQRTKLTGLWDVEATELGISKKSAKARSDYCHRSWYDKRRVKRAKRRAARARD